MTRAVKIDPYAARPTITPDAKFAASTLLSRARTVETAVCGSCATTVGVELAIGALELMLKDAPALLEALRQINGGTNA